MSCKKASYELLEESMVTSYKGKTVCTYSLLNINRHES